MQSFSAAKIKVLLILPILLLMVQLGIVLLHNHSADSWYDDHDASHNLSVNVLDKFANGTKAFKYTPNNPTIHSAVVNIAAPSFMFFHQAHLPFSSSPPSVTSSLFPKRAPPA